MSRVASVLSYCRKHKFAVAFSGGTILALVIFSPWLWAWAVVSFVAAESYPDGVPDKPSPVPFHGDNIRLLAQHPPRRLASLLRTPQDRVRATICMVFRHPDRFPEDADWSGVAPALARTMFADRSAYVAHLASDALRHIPVTGADEPALLEFLTADPDHAVWGDGFGPRHQLMRLLLEMHPDSDSSDSSPVRKRIDELADSESVRDRCVALNLLASYFPSDEQIGRVAGKLLALEEQSFDIRAAVAVALQSNPLQFVGLLEEPATGAALLNHIEVLRGYRSPSFETVRPSGPEFDELFAAADRKAAELLHGDDEQRAQAAVGYLADARPETLIAIGPELPSRPRTTLLERFARDSRGATLDSIWDRHRESMVEHAPRYLAIVFDEQATSEEREQAAYMLLTPMLGRMVHPLEPDDELFSPANRDRFLELLSAGDGDPKTLALAYFSHRVEPAPHEVPVLLSQLDDLRNSRQVELTVRLFESRPEDPRVVELAQAIVSDDSHLSTLRFEAMLMLLRKVPADEQPGYLVSHLENSEQQLAGYTAFQIFKRLLGKQEYDHLFGDSKFRELALDSLFSGETSAVSRLGEEKVEALESLFGADRIADEFRSMVRREFERRAESEPVGGSGIRSQTSHYRRAILDVSRECLQQQPEPGLAVAVAEALVSLDPPADGQVLTELVALALANSDEDAVEHGLSLIPRLQLSDKAEVLRLVREHATSETPSVLIKALEAWAVLEPDNPDLLAMLEHLAMNADPNYGVKQTASRLLGKVRSSQKAKRHKGATGRPQP